MGEFFLVLGRSFGRLLESFGSIQDTYKNNKHIKTYIKPCSITFENVLNVLNNVFKPFYQIFGQVFDQIFGQGFDQGLGEGISHKYIVQYYPAAGKTVLKPPKTLTNIQNYNPLNLLESLSTF